MKLIKIIILLSIFLGFSSVYAQTSNTETKKSDLKKNTEQSDPEIKAENQPQVLNAREENPATAKAPIITTKKQKDVFVKTRPYPSELDNTQPQQTKSNDNQVITTDKRSKQKITPANPDLNKINLNAKDQDYE